MLPDGYNGGWNGGGGTYLSPAMRFRWNRTTRNEYKHPGLLPFKNHSPVSEPGPWGWRVNNNHWRKLKVHDQLFKAKVLEPDEFKYSEILDSNCFILGGYISTNGEAPCLEKEAAILGYPVEEHIRLSEILLNQNLIQRDKQNRLFSPAILRELHISEVRAQAGIKGGNPILLNQKDKEKDKQDSISISMSSDSKDGESEGKGKPRTFDADSIEFKLASLLRVLVAERKNKIPVPGETPEELHNWSDTIHKILKSGVDKDDLAETIDWSQKNKFWKKPVCDADSLRRNYTKLVSAMEEASTTYDGKGV
jgi:hypothetical protein